MDLTDKKLFAMVNDHADSAKRRKFQRRLNTIDRECAAMADRLGKISERRKK